MKKYGWLWLYANFFIGKIVVAHTIVATMQMSEIATLIPYSDLFDVTSRFSNPLSHFTMEGKLSAKSIPKYVSQ